MKNINTLLKEYEKEDILARVEDYTHSTDSYLGDIISEIADSETEIYYSGLIDWLKEDHEATDYIEDALDEFGTPKDSNGRADFFRIIQQGQYYQNEQKLYNNLDAIGKIWLLAYLQDKEHLTEITDEQADFIDELETNNNDQFCEILDKWNDYINENND